MNSFYDRWLFYYRNYGHKKGYECIIIYMGIRLKYSSLFERVAWIGRRRVLPHVDQIGAQQFRRRPAHELRRLRQQTEDKQQKVFMEISHTAFSCNVFISMIVNCLYLVVYILNWNYLLARQLGWSNWLGWVRSIFNYRHKNRQKTFHTHSTCHFTFIVHITINKYKFTLSFVCCFIFIVFILSLLDKLCRKMMKRWQSQ